MILSLADPGPETVPSTGFFLSVTLSLTDPGPETVPYTGVFLSVTLSPGTPLLNPVPSTGVFLSVKYNSTPELTEMLSPAPLGRERVRGREGVFTPSGLNSQI